MKIHFLKTEVKYFQPVEKLQKNFEYRYDDRDYQEGDILVLIASKEGKILKPPSSVHRVIDYKLSNYHDLKEGFCILGVSPKGPTQFLTNTQYDKLERKFDRVLVSNKTFSYEVE